MKKLIVLIVALLALAGASSSTNALGATKTTATVTSTTFTVTSKTAIQPVICICDDGGGWAPFTCDFAHINTPAYYGGGYWFVCNGFGHWDGPYRTPYGP
jgi:hypothetical protein